MTETKNALKTTEAVELNFSERFTNKVVSEFGSKAGALRINDYQRMLIQGYFVGINRALEKAEEERVRKNENNRDHKYDNNLSVTWNNVNMQDLALDVVHYARIGLDMMQENHVSPIPYKNKKTDKYDITLMPGYNGIRYIAENYALVKPKSVIIDLVYSNDVFKPIKKSISHPIEAYEFEITNPFDRGEIIGGFGYIEYEESSKNELIIMTMKDIMKRKPQYASANFWGGQSTEYKNGKKETVEKEGWLEEMCRKTLVREVYSAKHIPRDPRKIDENYLYMHQKESKLQEAEEAVHNEINVTANSIPIESVALPASKNEVNVTGKKNKPAEIKQENIEKAEEVEASSDFTEAPMF
jgi:recombination protein RecT